MPIEVDQVRLIVEWLGEQGALAGLNESYLTNSDLRVIAESMDRKISVKAKRKDIVNEIVFSASRRIDISLDRMLGMSSNDLLAYFENVRPSRTELLRMLGELDFHPGSEAQKSLYKYAARQISETGMFQRVAKKHSSS